MGTRITKRVWFKKMTVLALFALIAGQTVPADAAPFQETVEAADRIGGMNVGQPKISSAKAEAVIQLTKTAGASVGTPDAAGDMEGDVQYNRDNQKAYVANGKEGILSVFPMQEDGTLGKEQKINVKTMIPGFTYGDMMGIDIDTVHDRIAVSLQAADYKSNGQIAILSYDGTLLAYYEAGVQPGMVVFTKDGNKLLSANEGEPRNGYGSGEEDPAGSVTIIDFGQETPQAATVGFASFDSEKLAGKGVLFSKIGGSILSAEKDLEPEDIVITDDGSKAYVSLQEANAVAVLDLNQNRFTEIKSLGFTDLSKTENAVDVQEDGKYSPKQYKDAYAVRMPDGLALFEQGGKTYLLTANEGSPKEWGTKGKDGYFTNDAMKNLSATDGTEGNKVHALDSQVTAGLEEGKTYLFGGRSFSIFDTEGMELVYDSANEIEKKTAETFGAYFNCSDADNVCDSQSPKSGPEPGTATVGKVGGRTYAFIGLGQIGGIMVYDVTVPNESKFVSYINSRDFSGKVAGDVSPEELDFVLANDAAGKQPMVLAACDGSGTLAGYTVGGTGVENAVVLYTNDVHCGISGYANLAAYGRQMAEDGYRSILVDAGDSIQGDTVGTITEGAAIVDLMNQTGYELAIPGNHEFDYGVDTFLELAANQAAYKYLSSNFKKTSPDETVFDSYQIENIGGKKIAFVGISTPETYTKSSPAYFQDADGHFLYTFCENSLYATVQSAVDAARSKGADYVVALAHTGISGIAEGWRSTDIIANTSGIDVYLDGHSHETIPGTVYKNKEQKDVLLSSTGTKLEDFGKLSIGADGTFSTELVKVSDVDTNSCMEASLAYQAVQKSIDTYNKEILEKLQEKIGTTEVELTVNDYLTGEWRIRNGETNLGDFVADAYRQESGADIAFANGGGIRTSVLAGDVSRKNLMDVNPWNNAMCVIRATGQQILDALEFGARNYPEPNGGFLQVSGISYEINQSVKSPIITSDQGAFVSVDAAKPRRVQNVMVNGAAVDPAKTYTVAGNCYMMQQSGDGFTMFKGNEVVRQEDLLSDADMLVHYFMDTLGGKVTAGQYGKPMGRIQIVGAAPSPTPTKPAPSANPTIKPTAKPTTKPTAKPTAKPTPTPKPEVKKPKKAVITSLKNQKGKKLQVQIKKIKNVKGYQIKYSTSKKFKKNVTDTLTTSKTKVVLKKLKKGKIYYVKARAYVKDGSKKIYGNFSDVKKKKIKK